mgnify:CR=1 FL=1
MRIVVDLNTLVSGLLWRGTSRQLLDLTRAGRFELLTSAILLTELDDVLHRSKFAAPLHRAQLSADSLVADIARIAVLVTAADLPTPICRDPDDDDVLAAALGGYADAIISGDRDLLVLERFGEIPIIDAVQGVALVQRSLQSD